MADGISISFSTKMAAGHDRFLSLVSVVRVSFYKEIMLCLLLSNGLQNL